MDTVAMLSEGDDDDGPLTLEFKKATPKAATLFKPQSIWRGEDEWISAPSLSARAATDCERK